MSLASPAEVESVIEARPGAAGDRRLLRTAVLYCLVAFVAFAATCGVWELVIDRLHARPDVPEPFHSKIEAMFHSARETRIDTIFLGSSRFFHGIDPIAFDVETARLGMPTHSYNLGFDALDFAELRFLVQHLLADPRSHFKNLFIEPSLRVRLGKGLETSQRAVTLHDLPHSIYIANFLLRGNQDWKRKVFWLYEQGQVSLTRLSNVGAMTNRYIRPQEPPQDVEELVGVDGSGYSGLDPGKMLGQPVTAQGVDRLRADQSAAEQAGTARTLDDYEIAQLNELQHQAAAHGVRLFLLAHPTASPETFGEFSAVSRAEREGRLDMPLTSFADPVTYFDLYRPGGFTDPDHIDRIVAGQVSVKAADAFVAEMKSSKKGDTGAVH